jgi:hypothetical protein
MGPGEMGREASGFTFGYYDSEKSTGVGMGMWKWLEIAYLGLLELE